MERQLTEFSSRQAFQEQLLVCLARARLRLQLFDPDFALWGLGTPQADALLRRFLSGHGRIELVAHSNTHLERDCPRLMRLLKDFSHAIECRVTNKSLRQLTDSFCIADGEHIVRRFHCDHLRGESVLDGPADTQLYAERFAAIWTETEPGLHVSTTGL